MHLTGSNHPTGGNVTDHRCYKMDIRKNLRFSQPDSNRNKCPYSRIVSPLPIHELSHRLENRWLAETCSNRRLYSRFLAAHLAALVRVMLKMEIRFFKRDYPTQLASFSLSHSLRKNYARQLAMSYREKSFFNNTCSSFSSFLPYQQRTRDHFL